MAVCPFAKHLLIPAGSNDPRITPRVAILHVDAGNAFSLYEYFRDRSGGIESHFHIRNDGVIEQYRDTNYQADANNLANDFAVSIETQGYGAGVWNALQLASIKRLLTWLSEVHEIPLREVERWDGSGVGYHTLFGAPSEWTPVAKSCPGEDRKKQFHNDLVPWMSNPEGEWFDMATEAELRKIVREEMAALLDTKQGNDKTLRENIRIGANARDLAREILAALKGK